MQLSLKTKNKANEKKNDEMNIYSDNMFKIIWRNKQSRVGAIILAVFVLMAVLGPIFLDPPKADYLNRLQGPSLEHLLGTDFAGKDTLTQFILGAKDVLLVAVAAAVFAISFAVIVGVTCGLIGGKFDSVLMLITNIILTVPSFPITMILALVIRVDNFLSFGLLLSLWSWAGLAKSIRAQVLTLKHKDFIEASKILGISRFNIIRYDILPNISSYIALNFITITKGAILSSIGLMVLGLVPFQGNHWGVMLNVSMSQTAVLMGSSSAIYFFTPVVGMLLFQLGCYLFATGLDEALNPRLR